MAKKELQVIIPPLKAYLEDAYPLSVALTDPSRWDWLYCNYIQLIYQNPDIFLDQPLKFYKLSLNSGYVWDADCPVLIYDRVSRDMISFFGKDIIDIVCFAIKSGKYPIVYLDEYYLSYRSQYQKVHYIHENLFYGYDEERELLNGLAYVTDKEGYAFKKFSVRYAEVREAYQNLNYDDEMRNRVMFLSNEKERIYRFDIQAVILNLKEYINACPSEKRFAELSNTNLGETYKYGIGIYEPFIEYIRRRKTSANIIPFQILKEHKSLMLLRYRFMVENRYIRRNDEVEDGLKKIEMDASVLKMCFLKYQASRNSVMLEDVIDRLKRMKSEEKECLVNFLALIDKGYEPGNLIYSQNGKWNEIGRALETVGGKNIRISFRLHIFSDNTMGYIVFSTREKIKEYCDVAKVVIEVPYHRFKIDSDEGEIEIPDIKCNVGEYSVSIDINLTQGNYCCEIASEGKERGYLECRIKQKNVRCFPIDRVAIIHDYSYRYAVSEIREEAIERQDN